MDISFVLIPIPPPSETPPRPSIVYHYTTGLKLRQILMSGHLQPSTAFLEPQEKPVVWCSTSPSWEPTTTKCSHPGPLGQKVTAQAQNGLARIVLPAVVAPHDMRQLPTLAGTSIETCMSLLVSGILLGSQPLTWRFALSSIPASLFLAVELFCFDESSWRRIDLAAHASTN